MQKTKIAILIPFLVPLAMGGLAAQSAPPTMPRQLTCIGIEDASPLYTPADLGSALLSCVVKKDYQHSAEIIFLSLAYGVFDSQRIVDPEIAGKTLDTLKEIEEFISSDDRDAIGQEIDQITTSPRNITVCSAVTAVGMPEYFPDYEGLPAAGVEGFLREDFMAETAWLAVLAEFGCQ